MIELFVCLGAGIPWSDAVLLPRRGSEGGDQVHPSGQHCHHSGRDQHPNREVPARHSDAVCARVCLIRDPRERR